MITNVNQEHIYISLAPRIKWTLFLFKFGNPKAVRNREFTREAKRPHHRPAAKTHVTPQIMSNWSRTLAVVSQVETLRKLLPIAAGGTKIKRERSLKFADLQGDSPPAERLHVALSRQIEWQQRSLKDSDGSSSASARLSGRVAEIWPESCFEFSQLVPSRTKRLLPPLSWHHFWGEASRRGERRRRPPQGAVPAAAGVAGRKAGRRLCDRSTTALHIHTATTSAEWKEGAHTVLMNISKHRDAFATQTVLFGSWPTMCKTFLKLPSCETGGGATELQPRTFLNTHVRSVKLWL